MRDEKQDNAESGLFFANGGMPVPVYEGQEFPFIIKSKCITLWLEIIDRDAKDDYNANYKLHKIIDEIELNMKARTIKQIAHSEAILVEGDIRTIPDHPGNGARTLNGTYTWENVEHQFRGGFECVQVRIPPEEPGRPTNGVLRTATMNVNGNYCGKYRHDGINIHPPNPNSKRHVWKNPWCKLSSTEIQASPYSMGCWQPRPDQNGKKLIEEMRAGTKINKLKITLNTTANTFGIIPDETIENAQAMRREFDRKKAELIAKKKRIADKLADEKAKKRKVV